jgi:hypothetical protein
MIAIAAVLATRAFRKIREFSCSIEGAKGGESDRPSSGIQGVFRRLKRVALKIGTALA